VTARAFSLAAVHFDDRGLVPVVVQDVVSGAVLMTAWANREALVRTLESGEAWFWSRSRRALWKKGESSGNTLGIDSLALDCDGDTVLARVVPRGPTCHLGTRTCFELADALGGSGVPPTLELGWLAEVLRQRADADPAVSYTARLLARGLERVAQKVGEEATEVVIAALRQPDDKLVGETADLLYHLLVLLQARGIPPAAVAAELARRHGLAGPASDGQGPPRGAMDPGFRQGDEGRSTAELAGHGLAGHEVREPAAVAAPAARFPAAPAAPPPSPTEETGPLDLAVGPSGAPTADPLDGAAAQAVVEAAVVDSVVAEPAVAAPGATANPDLALPRTTVTAPADPAPPPGVAGAASQTPRPTAPVPAPEAAPPAPLPPTSGDPR
jgi:phosphoribosyl-ATP pyrophosphohydrolase/phosphoribosyl-AMP cyclohydrolase